MLRGAGRADPGEDMPAAAAAAGSAPDSTAAELERRSRSRVARAAAVAAAALCQMLLLLLLLLDCACMMTDVLYARGCHSAVCPVGSWLHGWAVSVGGISVTDRLHCVLREFSALRARKKSYPRSVQNNKKTLSPKERDFELFIGLCSEERQTNIPIFQYFRRRESKDCHRQ